MIELAALSLAPAARDWLRSAVEPRVLHVFDRACNLIDARGEVLSIVATSIGDGPFSIVVPIERDFSELITIDSEIEIGKLGVVIGSLGISVANASSWPPQPRWDEARLASVILRREASKNLSFDINSSSIEFEIPRSLRSLGMTISTLSEAVAHDDAESCRFISRQLAGLGIGLTPAGDDFLIGAMHALWLLKPMDEAMALTQAMASEAAPLTTSLSAVWLRAAARGEASSRWHALIDALIDDDQNDLQRAINTILNIGYTSGRDALAGFTTVLHSIESASPRLAYADS